MISRNRSFPWAAVLSAIIGLYLLGTIPAVAGGPTPAKHAVNADRQLHLSPSDRCPVCAMFPARQPASAAAMTLKTGETFYFCSNGCLLRAFLRPQAYLNVHPGKIEGLTVLDYFSGQPTDARTATWVAGSDVIGPMGPAIIALADAAQLAVFKRRHGGHTIFTLDQLTSDLWKRISHFDLPPAAR